jgi:hypothetical protein
MSSRSVVDANAVDSSSSLNQPVVIDNGSGLCKAGFAGAEQPKLVFPAYVGRAKHVRVMAGATEGEVFVGEQARALRGILKLNYPIKHGITHDWDDMQVHTTHTSHNNHHALQHCTAHPTLFIRSLSFSLPLAAHFTPHHSLTHFSISLLAHSHDSLSRSIACDVWCFVLCEPAQCCCP